MDKKTIFRLYIIGAVFAILLGSFLHFTYDLSGKNIIVGSFSAVNESVWEHLKLAFFSLIFFGIIETFLFKKEMTRFLYAKLLECFVAPAFIIVFFYTYTGIVGRNFLIVDILSFVVAVILGRAVGYKAFNWRGKIHFSVVVSALFLVLMLAGFIVFTINPPRIPLFRDSVTNEYGIR